MVTEAGDSHYDHAIKVKWESDGSGTKGDLVALNGSGQVTPTSGATDALFGVLSEDSPAAGEGVGVHIHGPVKVTAEGSVSKGDLLEGNSTTNGTAATSAASLVTAVDEGGTDTYNIHSKPLVAQEGAADAEDFWAYMG